MELEDLLRSEGLVPGGMDDTLAWARERAEELVAGLVADSELGPLLDADYVASSAAVSLPPPPSRPDLPEVGPGVESEPMADAAYDQGSVVAPTPQPDDAGLPGDIAVGLPSLRIDPPGDEVTQPRSVEATPTHSEAIEIDDDDLEMLDDDDLELVDEAPPQQDTAVAPAGPTEVGRQDGREEIPEWKAALTSASLGGGAQADQDSGLYRISGGAVRNVLTDPAQGAAPPAPIETAPLKVERDESMDIDLGEF